MGPNLIAMHAILKRKYHADVTTGVLKMYYDAMDTENEPLFQCKTIELPWLENRSFVSCVPEGIYQCDPRRSPRHGHHFLLKDVPGRDLILFHVANFTRELEGCIAVGTAHWDIDGDGITDVAYSRMAMDDLLRHGGYHRGGFTVEIMSG